MALEKEMTAMQSTVAIAVNQPHFITTEELAALLRIVPQTPRASLCRFGHYMGMRPVKLPNGRLLWNASDVARLTSGEVA